MIKLRGYLGGHCPNIGTTKVTRIIGAIGRNWMNFGIRIICWVFKKTILVMFRCPTRSGETNSERHLPGGKSRKPLRTGRSFDFLSRYESDSPTHVRFLSLQYIYLTHIYSIILSSPQARPCLLDVPIM